MIRTNLDNLPQELKDLNNWVFTKKSFNPVDTERNNEEKIPYNSNNEGYMAKSNNTSTWSSINKSIQSASSYDGYIGFQFGLNNNKSGYLGIDIDKCVDKNGNVSDYAIEIIELFDSYTEFSKSGTGIHIIIKAEKKENSCELNGIEMYDFGRQFVLTGNVYEEYDKINDCQEIFDEFLDELIILDSEKGVEKNKCGISFKSENKFDMPICIKTLLDRNAEIHGDNKNKVRFVLVVYLFKQGFSLNECIEKLSHLNYNNMEKDVKGIYKSLIKGAEYDVGCGPTSRLRAIVNEGLTICNKCSERFKDSVLNYLFNGDDGDSELFTKIYKNKLLFDQKDSEWYEFNGIYYEKRFEEDLLSKFGQLKKYYEDYKKYLKSWEYIESDQENINEKIEFVTKRINGLSRTQKQLSIIKKCKGYELLGDNNIEWGNNPYLIGCKNCIIDIRTGEEIKNDGTIFIKDTCDVEWKGINEQSPVFSAFLDDIFNSDEKLKKINHQLLGSSIIGKSNQAVFPIYYGPKGRNGKSTLFKTIHSVLGKNLVTCFNNELILKQTFTKHSSTASPDLMALKGKRIAYSSEIPKEREIDTVEVKRLTGDDIIGARNLFKNKEEFYPSHTMFLFCNHLPDADAQDEAFWRRVVILPFEVSFIYNPNPDKPNERKEDIDIFSKIISEKSGILAWLVRGYIGYSKNGFDIPDICRQASTNYRTNEDVFGQFLEEHCQFGTGYEVKSGELHKLAKIYKIENDLNKFPISPKEWGIEMGSRFVGKNKNCGKVYIGLEIKPQKSDDDVCAENGYQ